MYNCRNAYIYIIIYIFFFDMCSQKEINIHNFCQNDTVFRCNQHMLKFFQIICRKSYNIYIYRIKAKCRYHHLQVHTHSRQRKTHFGGGLKRCCKNRSLTEFGSFKFRPLTAGTAARSLGNSNHACAQYEVSGMSGAPKRISILSFEVE